MPSWPEAISYPAFAQASSFRSRKDTVIAYSPGSFCSLKGSGYTPEENGPFEEPEAVPAGEEGYSTAEMDGAYQEEDYNEDYGAGEYNGQDDAADSEEDAQKKTLRERFTEHFTGEMDALAEHYTEEYTDDFDTEGVPEQMMADIARMEQDATERIRRNIAPILTRLTILKSRSVISIRSLVAGASPTNIEVGS